MRIFRNLSLAILVHLLFIYQPLVAQTELSVTIDFLIRRTLQQQQAGFSCPDHLLPLSNTIFLGKHYYLTSTLSIQSIKSPDDYRQALMRLQRIPAFIINLLL